MENITFNKGDAIIITEGAKFASGGDVQKEYLNTKLYIKEIRKNNRYAIAPALDQPIIGTIDIAYLVKYVEEASPTFLVNTIAKTVEVHKLPNETSFVTGTLGFNEIYTIVKEKNGYGRLKNGLGWINLRYTEKL